MARMGKGWAVGFPAKDDCFDFVPECPRAGLCCVPSNIERHRKG